jgi:hypothetical protein
LTGSVFYFKVTNLIRSNSKVNKITAHCRARHFSDPERRVDTVDADIADTSLPFSVEQLTTDTQLEYQACDESGYHRPKDK